VAEASTAGSEHFGKYRIMTRSAVWISVLSLAVLVATHASSRAEELDLPMRKAGLWDMKMRMTGGGAPTMSMQQCTDASTDKELRTIYSPLAKETCDKRTVQKTATGFTVERVCKRGDDTITTHIEITGDFDSAYQAHLVSRTQDQSPDDPPLSDLTLEAKFLGPCKSGQVPGDIIMMGGMKINLRDVLKLRQQQGDASN
jgi:uncharacterized protein DUF3617